MDVCFFGCEYLCFMDKNKVMLVIYIIIWYRIK